MAARPLALESPAATPPGHASSTKSSSLHASLSTCSPGWASLKAPGAEEGARGTLGGQAPSADTPPRIPAKPGESQAAGLAQGRALRPPPTSLTRALRHQPLTVSSEGRGAGGPGCPGAGQLGEGSSLGPATSHGLYVSAEGLRRALHSARHSHWLTVGTLPGMGNGKSFQNLSGLKPQRSFH